MEAVTAKTKRDVLDPLNIMIPFVDAMHQLRDYTRQLEILCGLLEHTHWSEEDRTVIGYMVHDVVHRLRNEPCSYVKEADDASAKYQAYQAESESQ